MHTSPCASSSVCFYKCLISQIHRYHIVQNSFDALKKIPFTYSTLPYILWTPHNHWSLCWLHCFALSRMSYIIGIRQYVAFWDWLFSLNNVHLSFIHVFSWLDIFLLFHFFIHPSLCCTHIYLKRIKNFFFFFKFGSFYEKLEYV